MRNQRSKERTKRKRRVADIKKLLAIGRGGREAAMVWALAKKKGVQIFCAPGNAGIAEYATCVPIAETDINGLLEFAKREGIDLTIVGPEVPLVAGIVDRFRKAGLLICGPMKRHARLEGSKVRFKRLLVKYGIPTAPFKVFRKKGPALAYIKKCGVGNIVIKMDALAAGKGVILPNSIEEAEDAVTKFLEKGLIIIEKRLSGVERSAIAITDGEKVDMLPFTQDYKRVGDGDTGPNTGGTGAHTLPLDEDEEERLAQVLIAVAVAIAAEIGPYTGFIYIGIIMTADGPMVLELNCRLGDPEAQAILTSIKGDFLALCLAAAQGNLAAVAEPKRARHSFCLVLMSEKYPDPSDRDDPIEGLDAAEKAGALLLHAGTAKREGGAITTNKSGRMVGVVCTGKTLKRARRKAYRAAEHIRFPGMKFRRDIGQGVRG